MELKQTNQQKQTKIPSVHVYLNVTTPVVGLMLKEEQSMEYICVAPTSGSVTSNDGFPIVVPAFNYEIYQSTKFHFNKAIS